MISRARLSILLLVLVIILNTSCLGFAGTVGNASDINAPKGKGVFSLRQDKNITIKMGLDCEFLFDRDIDANAATNAKITSGEWYMTKISYLMFDRFQPYVTLGMAHMKAKWTELGSEVKLESDTNFAWGLGAKAFIYEFESPKIRILTDGFYRVADLDAEEGYSGGSKVTFDTSASRFLIREWQIALLATTEIDVSGSGREEVLGISTIIPYAGIKYSDINGRLRLTQSAATYHNPGTIESDDIFGIFVGCDFVGPNSILVNLEGRFLDETALTAGVDVLF
jgi:hypothetical protein